MNPLSNVQRDLVLLVKGQYGVFNDALAVQLISVLLQHHLLVGAKITDRLDIQCRHLMGALLAMIPNYFQEKPYQLQELVAKFCESPERGHETLRGFVALTLIYHRGVELIALGEPDPILRAKFDQLFPDRDPS